MKMKGKMNTVFTFLDIAYNKRCEQVLSQFPSTDKDITQTSYDTIGEFYMAIVYLLGRLSICGKKDIFNGWTKQLGWVDPKRLREVGNYDEALEGIKIIVDQGEGASAKNPLQQNANSSTLAHYFMFAAIFQGRELSINKKQTPDFKGNKNVSFDIVSILVS